MMTRHTSRRFLLSLALAFCLSGGLFFALWRTVPLRAQTTFPAQGEVKRDANLRSGPGATFPIQATAKAGDIITATAVDEAGKWYRLDTPTEQWIALALVRLLAPEETPLPPAPLLTSTTALSESADLSGTTTLSGTSALTPTVPLTAIDAIAAATILTATDALTSASELTATDALTAANGLTGTNPFGKTIVPTETAPQPVEAVVLRVANLRSGPGLTYEILGKAQPGDAVTIVGATPAQDWYLLDNGCWIASFLVQSSSSGSPTAPPAGSTFLPTMQGAPVLAATTEISPAFRVTVAIPPGAQAAEVMEVLSGDTIRVRIGAPTDLAQFTETVRYLAMDAPDVGERGLATATGANMTLAADQPVYLVRETSDRNLQGQLLRHVYTANGVFVNASLVASGYALPLAAPPDNLQAATFDLYGAEAAKASRGFWSNTGASGDGPAYALAIGPAALYSGPGSNNQAVTTLVQDMSLLIFGRTNDGAWVQVRTSQGLVGWAYVPQIAFRGSINALPVVASGVPGPAPAPIPGQAGAPGAVTTSDPAQIPGLPTPVPTPTPFYGAPTIVILTPQFTGPGPTFPTVGELQPGTTVSVYATNAELTWVLLTSGYWVPAVTVAGVPPNMPVVATPEAPPPNLTPLPTAILVPPPGTTFTPTPFPLPTDTPTPLPTVVPAANPQITELNKGEEWVMLFNYGAGYQDLTGWTLFSENGGEVCQLYGTLQPGAALKVWSRTATDGISCNLPVDMWRDDMPDAAVLRNPAQVSVSRLER